MVRSGIGGGGFLHEGGLYLSSNNLARAKARERVVGVWLMTSRLISGLSPLTKQSRVASGLSPWALLAKTVKAE